MFLILDSMKYLDIVIKIYLFKENYINKNNKITV